MVTIEDQGLSYVQYKADGLAVNFMLTFPYLRQQDISVYLDGVLVDTDDWSWLNDSEIQMDTAPVADALLTIKRTTEQSERLVDFQDGGQLNEATLDLDSNQMFYLSQEAIDTTNFNLAINSTDSTIDARNNKIINLADGTDPSDAVNLEQMEDADAAVLSAAAALAAAAQADADAAVTTANAAAATAANALSTANTSLSTANGIAAVANEALADAEDAQADAASALATANAQAAAVAAAQADADAAQASADAAQADATQALADAAAAQSDADAAQADATQALADAAAAQADADAAQADATQALSDAAAAQADADAAQADIDAHELLTAAHGATGAVVGTTNTQTLTNKRLDGADIRTPIRLDVKQDTKANLVTYALTASNGQLCFATDEKKMYQVIDTLLDDVGGGAGGINYFSNPDFETGVTGWGTYADAAGVAPVDGTGGSPTCTFTATTSSPLRGTQSGLFTKDAANRQGEGFKSDVTSDPADRYKVVLLSFDYETSANYVDGDMRIYLENLTSGEVKELAVRDLAANAHGTYSCPVQLDGTDSYRAIGHVATTSALAYTVKVDNFVLGPQKIIRGSLDSTWKSFIPTITNVTTSSLVGKFRRVGDTAEISVRAVLSAAPTGSIIVGFAAVGTLDTSKLPATSVFKNSATYYDDSTSTAYTGSPYLSTTTTVRFYSSHVAGEWDANSPVAAPASPDIVDFTISIPIVGWESSVILSEDSGNRQAVFKGYRNAALNVSTGNVKVSPDVTSFDSVGGWDSGNSRYTIQESGYYLLIGKMGFNSIADTGYGQCAVFVDGSVAASGTQARNGAAGEVHSLAVDLRFLNKGQNVELYSVQNDSASEAINTGSNASYLCVAKWSGNQTIGMTEVVACSYETNVGQTVTNGAVVLFEDKLFDTHNAYNTSTGQFTAPYSGLYRISSQLTTAAVSASVGNSFAVNLRSPNSLNHVGTQDIADSTTSRAFSGQATNVFRMNKGETIEVRIFETLPAVNLSGSESNNWVAIERIGA